MCWLDIPRVAEEFLPAELNDTYEAEHFPLRHSDLILFKTSRQLRGHRLAEGQVLAGLHWWINGENVRKSRYLTPHNTSSSENIIEGNSKNRRILSSFIGEGRSGSLVFLRLRYRSSAAGEKLTEGRGEMAEWNEGM